MHCAEQSYWIKIAQLAGDKLAERKVCDAKTGYEAKREGHKIKITQEIENLKEDIMAEVQDLKFTQNSELKRRLMATKGNLYEATLDKFFSYICYSRRNPKSVRGSRPGEIDWA